MWIKGGDAVWGNGASAPDDEDDQDHTHGELIAFRRSVSDSDPDVFNMTSDSAGTWILERTPPYFQKMVETNYSCGIERDEEVLKKNNADHRKWSNPLEIQLPYAPTTKIYCVYGHGKETERSYWYTRGEFQYDEIKPDAHNPMCSNDTVSGCITPAEKLDFPMYRKAWIDAEYTDSSVNPRVLNGVKMGEGDGTVSLLSLGAMCVEGWKRPRWNPAGMRVVTVELPHRPSSTIPRGGGTSGDHVDILGATALNEMIVKVATGAGDEIQDSYVSRIREYAKKVRWD